MLENIIDKIVEKLTPAALKLEADRADRAYKSTIESSLERSGVEVLSVEDWNRKGNVKYTCKVDGEEMTLHYSRPKMWRAHSGRHEISEGYLQIEVGSRRDLLETYEKSAEITTSDDAREDWTRKVAAFNRLIEQVALKEMGSSARYHESSTATFQALLYEERMDEGYIERSISGMVEAQRTAKRVIETCQLLK